MNYNPLVSIIFPAYNHEKYVQETINSIIAQTYQNIELIVIDDGSKDATFQKMQEMRKVCENRFARVYFKTRENVGVCKTLNELVSLSKGKYVYFTASDDVSKPDAISILVDFLDNHNDYVLCVGDDELIDKSSERVGWDKDQNIVPVDNATYKSFGAYIKTKKNFDVLSDKFGSYDTLVSGNYIPNGCLIRRDALIKIGKFTKEAPLEDWYMHLQLSKIGKYKYIDQILFAYRQHDNNTVKRRDYMLQITCQTQLYEEKLVAEIKDKKWKEIFDKNVNQVKMKFRIGDFVKLYKTKRIGSKKLILEILGHKYQIS